VTVAALATLSALLAAVPADAARLELRVRDAVASALAQGADAARAEAVVALARAERRRAGLVTPSNPVLSASLADDEQHADEGEWSNAVSLSQELWVPGQRGARVAAAEAELLAAELHRDWVRRRVAATTAAACTRLDVARRAEAHLTELAALLERLDEIAAIRLAAGDVSELERQRVGAEVEAARAELLLQGLQTARAREDLSRLVGVTLDEGVVVPDAPEPLGWDRFEGLAIEDVAEQRPDVRSAVARLDRAAARLRVERRERWPRPTLSVGLETERSVFGPDDFVGLPPEIEKLRLRDRDRFLVTELTFALPIFDANGSDIAEAIALHAQAAADLRAARLDARSELRLLAERGRALGQAHAALATASRLAAENLGLFEKAYALGKIGLTELLAQRDVALRTRLRHLDVASDLVAAELEAAASVGALGDFGIEVPASGSVP
jgi:outer membrane protein TolC